MTGALPTSTDHGVSNLLGRAAAGVALAFAVVAVVALTGLLAVPFSAEVYTVFSAVFVSLAWILRRLV